MVSHRHGMKAWILAAYLVLLQASMADENASPSLNRNLAIPLEATCEAWNMFPEQHKNFASILHRWGLKIDQEVAASPQGDLCSSMEKPVGLLLGIPPVALRLETNQDMLLALAVAAMKDSKKRRMWGLSTDQPVNRTVLPKGQIDLTHLTQQSPLSSWTEEVAGAMLLAQQSYLRCKRTGEAPALFSPTALSFISPVSNRTKNHNHNQNKGQEAEQSSRRREPMDLLDAIRSRLLWVKTMRANGWCHEVQMEVQNTLLARVKVRVRRGTMLEHGNWNGQRGVAVSRETHISLGPAESRIMMLPTVCTENSGLLPEGPLSLTPFLLSLPANLNLTNQSAIYALTAGAVGGTAADALLDAARTDTQRVGAAAAAAAAAAPQQRLSALLGAPWAPQVNALSRATATTALMDAARAGEHKVVGMLLSVARAKVDVVDGSLRTALHHAVRGGVHEDDSDDSHMGRVVAAGKLLSHGADINAVDR
jgi:hypothetical protein